jgi:hypothetical protein
MALSMIRWEVPVKCGILLASLPALQRHRTVSQKSHLNTLHHRPLKRLIVNRGRTILSRVEIARWFALKRFPLELNRKESQTVMKRVFEH